MKSTICWRKKFFSFSMIVLSMLFIIGCSDSGDDSNPFDNQGYNQGEKDKAPYITSDDNTIFTEGSAGTFRVIANGEPTPEIALTGALPAGVTFDVKTRRLSGIPAVGTNGTYNLTFTASNEVLPDATQNFTLTVYGPPTITSANNAKFYEESAKTFTFTANGTPTPTFSLTGTLPSGVTLTSAGVLSGIPAAETIGTYPLTITASNGVSPNATQNFTLTVNDKIAYQENFESFSGLSAEGWVSPAGVTGTIQIISDPTGSGRSYLLELQDTITSNGDIGAVVYSPVIEALRTANLTTNAIKTTILLDFYFAGSDGRWFVIGKTSHESFVMNDPSGSVDAYNNYVHSYIGIARNKWYSLKIIINNTFGSYDVEVTDPETSTVIGTITGKAFDTTDNYDSLHLIDSDGRLMFGSWFSYASCPNNSYGHVYIDNIEVEVD